jgi:hypothetical protein
MTPICEPAAVTLLAVKILLSPLCVVAVSLAGRRWGMAVAGVLGGLPVVAGPILLVVTLLHGDGFGADAAAGTLLGLAALTAFVVVYGRFAATAGPTQSVLCGWTAFLLGVAVLSLIQPPPALSLILVAASFALGLRLLPSASWPPQWPSGAVPDHHQRPCRLYPRPRWRRPSQHPAAQLPARLLRLRRLLFRARDHLARTGDRHGLRPRCDGGTRRSGDDLPPALAPLARALDLLEQAAKIVGAEVGIAQDAGESAPADLPVQRDNERVPAPWLLQADMAAALSDDFPAVLAQRFDQAFA